jgi:hypothetical protein
LSRSTTVSLAFPVDRRGGLTEGAPSSPSSMLFFGKPSPPSSKKLISPFSAHPCDRCVALAPLLFLPPL